MIRYDAKRQTLTFDLHEPEWRAFLVGLLRNLAAGAYRTPREWARLIKLVDAVENSRPEDAHFGPTLDQANGDEPYPDGDGKPCSKQRFHYNIEDGVHDADGVLL